MDDKKQSVCINSDCVYAPDKQNIQIPRTGKVPLFTCQSNSSKNYITAFPPAGGGRQLTSQVSYTDATGKCKTDDCTKTMSDLGFMSNFSTGPPCTGNYNCNELLTYKNFPGNLNADFTRKPGSDVINPATLGVPSYQLCKNDIGYTGQICYQQQVAMYNSSNGECDCVDIDLRPHPYCSLNGNLIVNTDSTLTCQCPNTWAYSPTKCEKITWDTHYNLAYFQAWYAGLANKKYPYYTGGTITLMKTCQEGIEGWSNFGVFIVCNQKKGWTLRGWSGNNILPIECPLTDSSSGEQIQTMFLNSNDVDGTREVAFQFDDNQGVLAGYANLNMNGYNWNLMSGKQANGISELTDLSICGGKYYFIAAGDLASNSPGCIVISAATYIDGADYTGDCTSHCNTTYPNYATDPSQAIAHNLCLVGCALPSGT